MLPDDRAPDRPHGTVSFLFTDIEGSTRLWEQDRVAMAGALERHDRILSEAVSAAGGIVFSTGGDGLAAAFRRAPDALRAAVQAQQNLQAEDWDPPLLVRMALHTGDVEERAGDYFGPPLNRCARLMAAGHGGQVLCSGVTSSLISDQLPDGVSLRNLGTHRLRDLSDPEAVFQVVQEGLRDGFPPLRSLDSYRGNLPVQPTAFVGREREVAEIAKALDEARVVTLCGVGGVGKTRLSLQVAADVVPRFPDGAWLVELASVGGADAVEETVAGAFGLQQSPGTAIGQSLLDHLRTKSLLLLLDNCEHLLGPVAGLVDTILRASPGVKILATSREGLGVPGERLVAVPSLETPDPDMEVDELLATEAVRLFTERARESRSDLALGAADAAAVGELCRRLDGIPLAIELAATRVRVMSPAEIVEHLDRRFKLLTAGRRTAVSRHQTLRSTVDWSYDLLEEPERATLRRLSVFSGDFDLSAAETVAGTEPIEAWEVSDLLFHLVDKSLVIADTSSIPTRYRLLETIRDYAWERLVEAGEADAAASRHCGHYLVLSEEQGAGLRGPEETICKSRVTRELDNIRTALRWATDAGDADRGLRIVDALALAGTLRGFLGTLPLEVARMPGAETNPLLAVALASAALGHNLQGDRGRAVELAEEALHIAEGHRGTPGGDHVYCRVCSSVCEIFANLGTTRALELARSWEEAARRLGDPFEIDEACTLVAGTETDVDKAIEAAEEALDGARLLGSPSRLAYACIILGSRLSQVDTSRAEAVFAEALDAALVAENDWVDSFAAHQLALLRARRGDYLGAVSALLQTGERAANRADHAIIGMMMAFLATALAAAGDDEGALVLGTWAERRGYSYDEASPTLQGIRDRYETLMAGLSADDRDRLAQRAAALDVAGAMALARQRADGLGSSQRGDPHVAP